MKCIGVTTGIVTTEEDDERILITFAGSTVGVVMDKGTSKALLKQLAILINAVWPDKGADE